MPTRSIEFYEITAKFSIRKKYWDIDNKTIDANILTDKIQQGIEVPIEDIHIQIQK